MRKTILQKQYSCCVQKIAQRNTKYPRAHEKGVAHAKCLEWVKPFKYAKTKGEKPFYKKIRDVLYKKPLEKKQKKNKNKTKTKTKAKQKQNKKQIFEK